LALTSFSGFRNFEWFIKTVCFFNFSQIFLSACRFLKIMSLINLNDLQSTLDKARQFSSKLTVWIFDNWMFQIRSSANHITVASEKSATLYLWSEYEITKLTTFKVPSNKLEIFWENIAVTNGSSIEIWSIQGSRKTEGPPQPRSAS
jgi:hypothetical protein